MITRAVELFARRGWTPFEFQIETWNAVLSGVDVLVHAPTGLGKTEAAFLGPALQDMSATPSKSRGLRILWITPLRALARDLARHLETTVRELGLAWRVEVRCSDTPQHVKRRQRATLPEVLITTPESLSLLLSWPDGEALLTSCRSVVVDEWHELLGTKRGVQVELGLARLRTISPGLRTIGLSASLGDPQRALDVLVPGDDARKRLVRADATRRIEIETLVPEQMGRMPWAGHLGLASLPRVVEVLEPVGTSLVFTNTRFQAEMWFRSLLEARPDWAGILALHHGSMDRELRAGVESLLADGALKVVVCTSSFDLGVDFPAVEQVVQIGSPKGLARFVQRAGRSGHRPGATSRIVCVPTHAIELAEFAAARTALQRGDMEPRIAVEKPLDVLVQHLVTLAIGSGLEPELAYDEVRRTHAFRELSREEFDWALDFAGRGGSTLSAYPQFARLTAENGRFVASSRRAAAIHRLNIGTITADGSVDVRFAKGARLGEVEEAFAARCRPGDPIRFAGRDLEVVAVQGMTLFVKRKKAPKSGAETPRWMGGKMPLSSHLGTALRREISRPREEWTAIPELDALRPILDLQARRSRVPGPSDVLVELAQVREDRLACVFPFEGRAVHEGIAALVAWRLAHRNAATISTTVTDYGFALVGRASFPDDPEIWRELCSPRDLDADLSSLLAGTDLARRQFRSIARVAGLIVQGFPGHKRRVRDLQASSSLIHDVFERYDPTNPLLAQARREVLERQFEVARLRAALVRMENSTWHVVTTEKLTPFSFPLWAESIRGEVSTEAWEVRVKRMALAVDRPRIAARKSAK